MPESIMLRIRSTIFTDTYGAVHDSTNAESLWCSIEVEHAPKEYHGIDLLRNMRTGMNLPLHSKL